MNDFHFYILSLYCNFVHWLYGFNTYGVNYLFSRTIKDIEGNVFFRDERRLFDAHYIIIEYVV